MSNFKNQVKEFLTPVEKVRNNLDPIRFKTGEVLIVDLNRSELKLIDKKKSLELLITITDSGFALSLNTVDELTIAANKINILASEQLNIKSAGNLIQEIGKDCLTETRGTNKNIAQIQKITATLGNVELKANDMVKLNGELVQLNCD